MMTWRQILRAGPVCALAVCTAIALAISAVQAQNSRIITKNDSKLIELAGYLLPDPSLVEEVKLSIERPEAYVETFAKRLGERGIRRAVPDLPWIALVDGIYFRGHVVEIHARESLEEMAHEIDKLLVGQPKELDRWAWMTAPEWRDKYPEQLFPTIGARLFARGLGLVSIDIRSDSSPLIVLPVDRLAKAARLAKLAGYGSLICWVPSHAVPKLSYCKPPPVSTAHRPH
jgi:hypothetical protein